VKGNVRLPWDSVFRPPSLALKRQALAAKYIDMVGSDTGKGSQACELSGGMRQACSVARSIGDAAEVFCSDEALSALDALTAKPIFRKDSRWRVLKS